MEYSLAGHFCIQEVDKMHQEIEVVMRVTEFYSPLSFLRILLKVKRNRPYCIIPMKSEDFKVFQNSLTMLQFSNIPYTKVFQLKLCKDDLHTLSNINYHIQTLISIKYLLEKHPDKVAAAQITSTSPSN